MNVKHRIVRIVFAGVVFAIGVGAAVAAGAQTITQRPGVPTGVEAKLSTPPPPAPPLGYVIGPDDVLSVFVWREKDVSGDVVVRPDGMVSIPLMNDLKAAGLTPEEFRKVVEEAAKKMFEEPTVTIVVKQINSRNVFVHGQVMKPGKYPLLGPMTILQLLTTAGGLQEWADKKELMLFSATLKDAKGQQAVFRINYEELLQGKNLAKNNVELRPGDTLVVK